jgi:hypothetical protein
MQHSTITITTTGDNGSGQSKTRIRNKIIRSDSEQVTHQQPKFPPPISSYIPAKLFKLRAALNGINGEATNSDDRSRQPQDMSSRVKKLAKVFSLPQRQKSSQPPRTNPALRRQSVTNGKRNHLDPENRIRTYELAIADPFNPSACGAQVPDMYSGATSTFHAEGTMTVSSNGSGVASVLLTANPFIGSIDMTGNSLAGATSGQVFYAASPTVGAAVTLANMQAVLASFRVVGVGFKIKNLMPPTTATGRVIVAPMMEVGQGPGPALLAGVTITNQVVANTITGINTGSTTTGFPSDILELPGSEEYTVQDLIAGTCKFFLKPVTPDAFSFHNTNDTTSVSATVGLSGAVAYTIATGAVVNSGSDNFDLTDFKGWQSMAIRGEGFPNNTTLFEIKYVYHFEGTTALPSGSGALLPDAPSQPHINITGHQNVLSRILSKKNIGLVSEFTKNFAIGAASGGAAGGGMALLTTALAKLGVQM